MQIGNCDDFGHGRRVDPGSDPGGQRGLPDLLRRRPAPAQLANFELPFLILSANSMPLVTTSAIWNLFNPNMGRNRCLILPHACTDRESGQLYWEQGSTEMTITVELPDDVAQALFPAGTDDPSRTAVEAIALEGYRSRQLTAAQVRRMLGFETRMEVDAFLKEHGVEADYSAADLQRDQTTLHRLRRE